MAKSEKRRRPKRVPKDEILRVRVNRRMYDAFEEMADQRSESISLVVREALGDYIIKKKPNT